MRRTRRLVLGGALVAIATGGALLGSGSARTYAGPIAETTSAAAPCPKATNPVDGAHDPYQLAFTGSLAGALSITSSPAGAVTLPSIAGTFCGLLELPLERAEVAPANLTLAPVDATIARATVPATVEATGQTLGSVALVAAPDNGLNLTLAAPVAARTGLFGVSCVLPVTLDLSTTAPGGSPLVGPLSAAHATVAQTGFVIDPAVSTGTAGTCPSYLATQVDDLLGLPNAHTSTTVGVNLDVVIP